MNKYVKSFLAIAVGAAVGIFILNPVRAKSAELQKPPTATPAQWAAHLAYVDGLKFKVYPQDPTPYFYLTNSTCTAKNAFGCTSGAGSAADSSSQ